MKRFGSDLNTPKVACRMPVVMTRGGTTYYFAYDQVGSLRAVADFSGNVLKQIEYDSFGNIIDDTDPSFDIPFGFSGGLYDKDTGLAKFGHKDYDSDIGRWTAKDPILFDGGGTDLYVYCLNDPVNGFDPSGLGWLSDTYSQVSSIISTSVTFESCRRWFCSDPGQVRDHLSRRRHATAWRRPTTKPIRSNANRSFIENRISFSHCRCDRVS